MRHSLLTSFQTNKDVALTGGGLTDLDLQHSTCQFHPYSMKLQVPDFLVFTRRHSFSGRYRTLDYTFIVLSVSASLALDLTTRLDLLLYAQAFNVRQNYTLELLALVEVVMTLLAEQLR